MKYIVELKSDLDLLNEEDAKQRYLEFLAAGYKENNIFVAAPVNVTSDVAFGTPYSTSGAAGSPNSGKTSAHTPGQSLTNSIDDPNPSSVEEEMFVNPS